jgi:hypothetical protein
LVSVGSKRRVNAIHDILERASADGRLRERFYSIVDRDYEGPIPAESEQRFAWDVYHIENYLLEPQYIREAMRSLQLGGDLPSEQEIADSLRQCAADTVDDLVRSQMDQFVNGELVKCVSTKFTSGLAIVSGFRDAAERSVQRMRDALQEHLTLDELADKEKQFRNDLESALQSETWRSVFKGRDILRRFTGTHQSVLGVPYEKLRNLIVNRMRETGHRPEGMERVLAAIAAHGA